MKSVALGTLAAIAIALVSSLILNGAQADSSIAYTGQGAKIGVSEAGSNLVGKDFKGAK